MPTYVLSKVKRTGVGQKIGDLVDQEASPTELTGIASDDRVPVQDVSDTGSPWKWFSLSRLTTYLNGVIAPAWSRVTGKPTTFPPSAHTHAYADITSKPSTFTPSAHTHAYADITSKPSTFTPSAHNHDASAITTGKIDIERLPVILNRNAAQLTAFYDPPVAFDGTAALTVTLTPRSATKKIAIYLHIWLGRTTDFGESASVHYRVRRGSTVVYSNSSDDALSSDDEPVDITLIDEPGSSATQSYTLEFTAASNTRGVTPPTNMIVEEL